MSEIRKVNVKYRYPWDSLEVDGVFTIPVENAGGINYHRQLVYAANKRFKSKELPHRFKSSLKSDGTVEIRRVS